MEISGEFSQRERGSNKEPPDTQIERHTIHMTEDFPMGISMNSKGEWALERFQIYQLEQKTHVKASFNTLKSSNHPMGKSKQQ